MAMCDETSLVKPDDYIAADYYDKLFPVQHYRLVDFNANQHRYSTSFWKVTQIKNTNSI